MLTTMIEISAIQAERLEGLAKRSHLPLLEIVDIMLEVTAAGVDAARSSSDGLVTVESVVRALQKIHSASLPDPEGGPLPRNIAEKIQREAAARAAKRCTPEWLAAEAVRAKARAEGVGFNFMSGYPKVDGVEYQNEIRDPW